MNLKERVILYLTSRIAAFFCDAESDASVKCGQLAWALLPSQEVQS